MHHYFKKLLYSSVSCIILECILVRILMLQLLKFLYHRFPLFFHEVLRLYPLVAMLNRAVYKDTQVGDMYFPAGVQVALPTILVHHDHEIWGDDAKEFNPERFVEGVLKATKN